MRRRLAGSRIRAFSFAGRNWQGLARRGLRSSGVGSARIRRRSFRVRSGPFQPGVSHWSDGTPADPVQSSHFNPRVAARFLTNRMKNTLNCGPLLAVITLTLSGCVSSHYQLAKSANANPAVILDLKTTPGVGGSEPSSLADASLRNVIVYHGPGSWKRDAYWDEYVVSITNRGTAPLVIETATLADFQGNSTSPCADPWTLEKESLTSWQKLKSSQMGNQLALGAGAVGTVRTPAIAASSTGKSAAPDNVATTVLAGAAATTLVAAPIYAGTSAIASIATGGFLGPATAASTALAGAATATLVAAPIYVVTVAVINSNNKARVLAEFERRRLPLPLTLAPGASANGSFFFRLSPGPRHLTVRGRSDRNRCDLSVDLTSLSALHLKPEMPVSPAPIPKSNSP